MSRHGREPEPLRASPHADLFACVEEPTAPRDSAPSRLFAIGLGCAGIGLLAIGIGAWSTQGSGVFVALVLSGLAWCF